MARYGMVIDLDRCMGCRACMEACKVENNTPTAHLWMYVFRFEEGTFPNTHVWFMPRPCMHCDNAPCVKVCPVGARYKREDGLTATDWERCIGCRYCEVACPYGARAFNWDEFTGPNPEVPTWGQPEVPRRPRGVVEKCSFCFQRIDRGLARGLMPGVDAEATPACVVACPVKARIFGNLNDPESEVSRWLASNPSYRLREDLGTAPRVYYLPAREQVATQTSPGPAAVSNRQALPVRQEVTSP